MYFTLNWLISLIFLFYIYGASYRVIVNELCMNILRIGHNYAIVSGILSHHVYFTDILLDGIYFIETGGIDRKIPSSRLSLCLRFYFSPSFGADPHRKLITIPVQGDFGN